MSECMTLDVLNTFGTFLIPSIVTRRITRFFDPNDP